MYHAHLTAKRRIHSAHQPNTFAVSFFEEIVLSCKGSLSADNWKPQKQTQKKG